MCSLHIYLSQYSMDGKKNNGHKFKGFLDPNLMFFGFDHVEKSGCEVSGSDKNTRIHPDPQLSFRATLNRRSGGRTVPTSPFINLSGLLSNNQNFVDCCFFLFLFSL